MGNHQLATFSTGKRTLEADGRQLPKPGHGDL
jgi:hypothetical protein